MFLAGALVGPTALSTQPPNPQAMTLAACKATCDNDPECSRFLFGPTYGPNTNINLCWTHRTPTCTASTLAGMTTYVLDRGKLQPANLRLGLSFWPRQHR